MRRAIIARLFAAVIVCMGYVAWPIIAVNEATITHLFDKRYGIG